VLLGEIICDGIRRITQRKFARTADDDRLWFVHEKAMSREEFSDIFGTMIHVSRHRSEDGLVLTATRQRERYKIRADPVDQTVSNAE
jgi:hypothetical protein